jgi:nicotinamide-nucleotide amidase
MKVGMLIVATEILEGKINDLNGRYLSEFLRPFHLAVETSVTVRDIEQDIHSALDHLLKHCDLIVTSGGLGPTKDDLTKDSLGTYLGRRCAFSETANTVALENYRRFDRDYPGKEHVYSQMPEDFLPLSNSMGMAPGLFVQHIDKHLICAPGVPREFKAILNDHLAPWIKKHYLPNEFTENVVARTRGVPEEKIFGEVDSGLWQCLSTFGDVSSLPNPLGVDIGVKVKAESDRELKEKIASLLAVFSASPISSSIWHTGFEKLEEIIVKMANQHNITYGFAESCTGGLCSHKMTAVPGSSQTFLGSIISYDTQVKINSLKVDPSIIEKHGVVSTQTAEAMAEGLAKGLGLEVAISTTGIAGPTGGSEKDPVGTVCIGIYSKGRSKSQRHNFKGDREGLKERFAQAALFALFEELRS